MVTKLLSFLIVKILVCQGNALALAHAKPARRPRGPIPSPTLRPPPRALDRRCAATSGSAAVIRRPRSPRRTRTHDPERTGQLLWLTSGAVTALIDRLEDSGWASRDPHPEDRRKIVVSLTNKAWQIGQDELKPYLEAIDTATNELSQDERAVVVAFLESLIDKVAAHAPGR